jgi:DNA-binding response OmpR family regulator
VETADNADDGLELIDSGRPDLVCLDIMMPKKSGISLYTQMKSTEELRKTPVIIISGVIQSGQFDFRDYVADESVPAPEAYLEKPIDVHRFLQQVRALIGQEQKNNTPRPS